MSTPRRLQLSRAKGWRLPAHAVTVARPGRWGNPFKVEVFGRERAIALFRAALTGDWPGVEALPEEMRVEAQAGYEGLRKKLGQDAVATVRASLRGHDLACWCRLNEACHADVLLAIANSAE
ncbi:MAG TPA: DUF4326 domain-containing protein [Burkholderiaceae bacterium]